jgi:hypothetical protein
VPNHCRSRGRADPAEDSEDGRHGPGPCAASRAGLGLRALLPELAIVLLLCQGPGVPPSRALTAAGPAPALPPACPTCESQAMSVGTGASSFDTRGRAARIRPGPPTTHSHAARSPSVRGRRGAGRLSVALSLLHDAHTRTRLFRPPSLPEYRDQQYYQSEECQTS